MSAIPIEPPSNIEARLTRVESDVSHLGTTMGDMRLDFREMARKLDTLTPSSVTNDLRADFRELRGDFRELRGECADQRGEFGYLRGEFGGIRSEFVGMCNEFGSLSVVFGTMAKGFHWL